jgi:MFS superfamily sulfate permease-like transporter
VYLCCLGLGRPVLLAECGATTQLANIFSGLVVLVVLLALGPLFYCLPLVSFFNEFGEFWELGNFESFF